MTDIEVGERYVAEELPENEMNNNGNLEWVADDTLALAHNGTTYEFKFAVECTAIFEVTDSGEINVIDGEMK